MSPARGTGVCVGDAEGFEAFVAASSRGLLRLGWLLCGDWPGGEDLVQSALAVTWSNWDSLADPGAASAYTHRVLVRVFLRGRRRRWVGEVPHAAIPDCPVPGGEATGVEERLVLQGALADLPGRQRAVLALRFFADLSEADTASALGCSVGTVKTHTARALSRLRSHPQLVGLLREEVSE